MNAFTDYKDPRVVQTLDSAFNSVRFQVSVLIPTPTRIGTDMIAVKRTRKKLLHKTENCVTVAT